MIAFGPMVAVVIPCFKVREHILEVLSGIGAEVSHILVVDDACPEHTGAWVQAQCKDPRVEVIRHASNQGVGGATLTGFLRARELGARVVVKLDGDLQMDPRRIAALIRPIEQGQADYTKGNRFFSPQFLSQMPWVRLFGNSALCFVAKISSGYWRLMDPTNGFVALHTSLVPLIGTEKLDRGYFFESDMLFRLNTLRAVVVDVPMPARYGSEKSSLPVVGAFFTFGFKHLRCFIKRITYNYFVRDFNLGSVQGMAGLLLIGAGVSFGALSWWENARAGRYSPVGTVMLAALPVLVGFQLLLSAINYDILSEPRTPLHTQL